MSPAQWRVYADGGNPGDVAVLDEGGNVVAENIHPNVARLLAAAPDLLAALERCLADLEALTDDVDDDSAIREARAAIARARGDK